MSPTTILSRFLSDGRRKVRASTQDSGQLVHCQSDEPVCTLCLLCIGEQSFGARALSVPLVCVSYEDSLTVSPKVWW